MALIKCSKCGKKISDKAPKCIHCGSPINSQNELNDKVVEMYNKNKTLIIVGTFILVVIFIFIVVNRINSQNEWESEYDKERRCHDKMMDYNKKTGRCMTADEAYYDCLTDPDCTWAK